MINIEYEFSYLATLKEPLQIGAGPFGARAFVEVTGGTFEDKRLNGKILAEGGDYTDRPRWIRQARRSRPIGHQRWRGTIPAAHGLARNERQGHQGTRERWNNRLRRPLFSQHSADRDR